MILIAGGEADPNVHRVVDAVRRTDAKVCVLLVGSDLTPRLTWNVTDDDALRLNDEQIDPAAVFLRYDVFGALTTASAAAAERAHLWYTALSGWLIAHPAVATLNRPWLLAQLSKPATLRAAAGAGLRIPPTRVTNDIGLLEAASNSGPFIAKPIGGGAYTERLGDAMRLVHRRNDVAAAPAIVQPELVPPELRVYRIGTEWHSFVVRSDALDYRTSSATTVEYVGAPPAQLRQSLETLLDRLGLAFAAADFKTCGQTGDLLFLEVNTAPMFDAFDRRASGAISRDIARYLTARSPR